MQTDGVLAETIAAAEQILGSDLDRITIERAVVGLFFTGVALSTGATGACATPARSMLEPSCCPSSPAMVAFADPLRGRPVRALLAEAASPHPLRRAVGVAVLNALAESCWQRRPHPGVELRGGIDAFDAAAITPRDHVVLVGAFIPFLRALKRLGQAYTVLERDPAMLKPEEMPHFRPAAEAEAVLPRGDVVLITGSTLLNDTLDALLRLCRSNVRVVVVGPTVGLLPDAFLRRGVAILGGVRVTDSGRFLDTLAEGGSGHHFFGQSAERVVLVRRAAEPAAQAAA
jgi:uncharacterized protein (DUF4213/DUF364 family)